MSTDIAEIGAEVTRAWQRYRESVDELEAVHTRLNRLTLVSDVLQYLADVPPGTLLELNDFSEDPNEDGRYDMWVTQVLDADGNPMFGFGGTMTDAGSVGGSDWDIFLSKDGEHLSVDLIRDWWNQEK